MVDPEVGKCYSPYPEQSYRKILAAFSGSNGLMVSTVQDVTENVRAQAALRESEERFRGIFEGSIEGISWSSEDGKILMLNPAMAKMLGYDSPQAAIQTISDLGQQVWMDPEERSRFIRQLVEQGTIRGYEMQFMRKDGTKRWSLLNGRSVLGPDGRIAHLEIFATDITERKQMARGRSISMR
jgi:PAS domain S-box-containing protein